MTAQTKMMDHLFRQQAGKMNSILLNKYGFEFASLIDDVIQETFLVASRQWVMKGMPENPEGWLMQVSKNKFLNELNRQKRHGKLNYNALEISDIDEVTESMSDTQIKQGQINVLFSCCSPQISVKAQIMLTLKIVSGFGDREIARALIMNEESVRKAIYRARNSIKVIGQSALNVSESDYEKRVDVVLRVLYLIFNEGYQSSTGYKLLDEDITFEAIRLTGWLLDLDLKDNGKIHALLALMFFNFSRFKARLSEKGEILDIEEQDRKKWSIELIHKGMYHQRKSRVSEQISKYHIESGISSVHCSSVSYEDTNWSQIIDYYQRLLKIDDSFQIWVNYAIAICEEGEPNKALEILRGINQKGAYKNSILFGAFARVHLKLKQIEMAKSYYKVAIDMTNNINERVFYETKISKLLLNTDGMSN